MKALILPLFALCLLSNRLSALEGTGVSALEASYEQENLLLQGNVAVEHGLGTLYAEKALLKKEKDNEDLPFSFIDLQDKVRILFKNKAILNCDTALFDFTTLTGKISSEKDNFATYNDTIERGSNSIPVEIQSKSIDLIFDKQEIPPLAQYSLKDVTAKDNVTVRYADEFVLQADETRYRKEEGGSLTAYPVLPNTFCMFRYGEETIETSSIEIFQEQEILHLKTPKGFLPSSLFASKQDGKLFLSCKDLVWNKSQGTLTLKDEIELEEKTFGRLLNDKTLIIEQNKEANSLSIKSILAQGKSVLSKEDSSLTTFGSLHVDGLQGKVTVSSPEKNGKVPTEKQVIYQNNEILLYADSACLEYTEPLQELSSLTFYGNIRIKSSETAKESRYALADKLLYIPDTKTLILSAHSGKKVLFWDKEQSTTLSAKEVHITQNPVTNKAEIKGIGNMKLSLSAEEQDRLKSRFPEFLEP